MEKQVLDTLFGLNFNLILRHMAKYMAEIVDVLIKEVMPLVLSATSCANIMT